MNNLITATRAEWVKIKGLGLIYAAIILGFLAPVLTFAGKVVYTLKLGAIKSVSANLFEGYVLDTYKFFALFLLLLFIIVAASRICQIDHKNGGWLLMETQPVTKLNIYLAKYVNLAFLIFVSILSFCLSCYLFVGLSEIFMPGVSLTSNFNIAWHTQLVVKMFISALGAASFMLFCSIFIVSYIWPIIIGVICILGNLYAAIRGEMLLFSPFFTEQLAFSNSNIRELNRFIGFSEYLSLFWTILFLSSGYLWFKEKSFKRAFFANPKMMGRTAIMVLAFYGLYFLITQPKVINTGDGKVKITGVITSVEVPSEVFLRDAQLGNIEQKTIKVKDGKFSWEGVLPDGFYTVSALNGKISTPLIVQKGGFYDLEFFYDGYKGEVFSRNSMKAELDGFRSSVISDAGLLAYNFKDEPEKFYKELEKYWQEVPELLADYRTSENYGFSENAKQYKLQMEAVFLLDIIKKYEKDRELQFKAPQQFYLALKKAVEKPLALTLKTPAYSDFIISEMRESEDEFSEVKKLKAGVEKDQLLVNYVSKALDDVKSVQEGEALLQELGGEFSEPKFKDAVFTKLENIKAQKRGASFPEMTFQDSKGKEVSIADFKGDFVVMEFWSTEKEESKKYKSIFNESLNHFWRYKDLVFLSVNLSDNKTEWKKFLSDNKSNPLLKDVIWTGGEIINESLPRYVIVDRNGNIYTFDAPKPDREAFSNLIEKIISSDK